METHHAEGDISNGWLDADLIRVQLHRDVSRAGDVGEIRMQKSMVALFIQLPRMFVTFVDPTNRKGVGP